MQTQTKKTASQGGQRTLGPVSDLERHLPSEWWKSLFVSLYLKTDGDVVENEENTKAEVNYLIEQAKIGQQDHILDLCCGQGRHAIELAKRGYCNVSGVDRSRYLIRLARKRVQQAGLSIKFSEGDARKVCMPENSFDCVYLMGNSFGYFEKEEDDTVVLESIKRVLVSEGKIALDITDGIWMRNNFEPRSWEWIDQNHFVCRERSLSNDNKRIISREVIVHAEKGVIADQFYAERLYDADQIRALLGKSGFTNITVSDGLSAASTRGQDLGMMANRLFASAMAPVKKVLRIPLAKAKEITVLMGDPRMSDSVKKDGVFNEEDFDTINKLKAALGSLSGYRFKYLDSHKVLLNHLQSKPPAFVLNLCDEGYRNDALKELHIPAILELLGIPYTGAGPAALGMCYNKSIVCSIAAKLDIPVPQETYFDPSDQAASIPSIFPALVKPNCGDSSIGITKNAVVQNAEELIRYLDELRNKMPTTPILVQEFLEGTEYSVSIIGNPGNYETLPILKVDYSKLPKELPKILGYESKWLPESEYWNKIEYTEADLDEESRRKLIDYSTKLFERTGCQDYARFDFRADSCGVIKLLEVNPNPGWCWDGKLNMMAGYANLTYPQMLEMIINAAIDRCGNVFADEAMEQPNDLEVEPENLNQSALILG